MELSQLIPHTIKNWGNLQMSACLSSIRSLQQDQTNYKVVWEIKCYFTRSIVTLIDDLRKEEREKWICILSFQYLSQYLIFGYAWIWETVADFSFLGSKITADGDCSHEIKRHLLLGRKVMTNLDSIFKSRRHYFANKGSSSQGMVFPVVMYGCESWTVKKAEHQRIDAFKLCCWRRLLRVPWTARRSNQSILKEINPGISLEGTILKLKLQYFGHLMRRVDSLEKTLMLGRIGGRRRRGRQRMRWLDGIMTRRTWVWVNSGRWWWTGRPGVLRFMGLQRVGHD